MGEGNNQRVQLTKRLLKDSLIELLRETSIYKISIRELCERAGLNRTTFYKYYGSQFDLLKEMEADLLEHVQQALKQAPRFKAQTIAQICAYLEDNLSLCRLLINNNVDPEFPQRLFRTPVVQDELNRMLEARYSGERLEYAICFFTYGCFHLIRQWINKDVHEPPEEIAELMMSLIEQVT